MEKKYRIQFWDTSGQKIFKSIDHCYFENTNVFFLVYDITDRESFERIDECFTDIMEYNPIQP